MAVVITYAKIEESDYVLLKKNIKFVCLFVLTGASHAQQHWGSVYMDLKTGITGSSTNYATERLAKEVANKTCIQKHKGKKNDCTSLVSFSNACAAVYWSPVNNKYGWGTNDVYLNRAKNAAHSSCVRKGGENCQLSVTVCTTRYY